MCLELLYEVRQIKWSTVFISYGCIPLKREKNRFFEMERKEMYSHTFKFRALCLKLSPEKLQGSVTTPPFWMFYLVIVWCKIHFKNWYQRNQTTMFSSKGGSLTYWCKVSVHTHLLSLLLLKLTENGECLRYTQSYPWRWVFFYAGVYAWIKGTPSLIYFVEQMCETNSFCLVSFLYSHHVILRKIWAIQETVWPVK